MKKDEVERKYGRYENLDQFYLKQLTEIRSASVLKLKDMYEHFKTVNDILNIIIRERKLNESKISFLKGRRKFINFLISDSRRQLKIYNVALNNMPINHKSNKRRSKWH